MFKYVMEFSKTGTICYISHLDIMRMFKRTFKKAGIKLTYSQGFNPHPKMGFAQPLSLGYEGLREYMEFETVEEYAPNFLYKNMSALMPEGILIKSCTYLNGLKKTLAAETLAADYSIDIPLKKSLFMDSEEMKRRYMSQEFITALKKQKKKKDLVQVDIKPMIRDISFSVADKEYDGEICGVLNISTVLDSGSVSNLSPELVITSVLHFFEIDTDRSEIDVTRKCILFSDKVNI